MSLKSCSLWGLKVLEVQSVCQSDVICFKSGDDRLTDQLIDWVAIASKNSNVFLHSYTLHMYLYWDYDLSHTWVQKSMFICIWALFECWVSFVCCVNEINCKLGWHWTSDSRNVTVADDRRDSMMTMNKLFIVTMNPHWIPTPVHVHTHTLIDQPTNNNLDNLVNFVTWYPKQ